MSGHAIPSPASSTCHSHSVLVSVTVPNTITEEDEDAIAQVLNPSVAFAPLAPAFPSLQSSTSLYENLASDRTPRNSPRSP